MNLRSDGNLVVVILVVVADQSRLEFRRWTAILVVVMLLLDERHAVFHFQAPAFFKREREKEMRDNINGEIQISVSSKYRTENGLTWEVEQNLEELTLVIQIALLLQAISVQSVSGYLLELPAIFTEHSAIDLGRLFGSRSTGTGSGAGLAAKSTAQKTKRTSL